MMNNEPDASISTPQKPKFLDQVRRSMRLGISRIAPRNPRSRGRGSSSFYTHVTREGGIGVRSPLDAMA
jgi:hypothetical protein